MTAQTGMQKLNLGGDQRAQSPRSNDSNPRTRSTRDSTQRARKRQVDRLCQQASRDRTKARIAYLENLVDDLQKHDNSGQIGRLMEHLNDVRREKDKLSKMLQSIIKITQSLQTSQEAAEVTFMTDLSSINQLMGGLEQQSNSNVVALSLENKYGDQLPDKEQQVPDSRSQGDIQGLQSQCSLLHGREIEGSRSASFANTSQPTVEPNPFSTNIDESAVSRFSPWSSPVEGPNTTCDCSTEGNMFFSNGSPRNLWRFANQVLLTAASNASFLTNEPERLCEDIPIRVVISGWDEVEQATGLDASWQMLRQIDQQLFSTCGMVERLAILRTMHLLLQSHIDPTTEKNVPAWYKSRPSQSLVPHSYAIDFFTWPGLRERFVYYEHRYCKNFFWELFRTSFRFAWPYEFRDCYTKNTETGMYRISLLFDQRLRDIQCWTMGPDMFSAFPEFHGDIPMINQIHRAVSSTKMHQKMPFIRQEVSDEFAVDPPDTEEASRQSASNLADCEDIFTAGDSSVVDLTMLMPEGI